MEDRAVRAKRRWTAAPRAAVRATRTSSGSAEAGPLDLLIALRAWWKPALLLAALFAAGSIAYAESLSDEFETSAVVAISPRTLGTDPDILNFVADEYVDFATADATVDSAARASGADPSSLTVDAEREDGTGNVTVTAHGESAADVAPVANEVARAIVRRGQHDRIVSAQVSARALPPSSPAGPRRRALEGAGVVGGLLLSLGLFLVIDRAAPRLRSWRDVGRATGYDVVGRVPTAVGTDVTSDRAVASAFRALRAVLEPKLEAADAAVLAVSAPVRGQGCTTVAAGLADAFVRGGSSVLLVDADLAHPSLGRPMQEAGGGLAAVLEGEAALRDALRPGWTDGLSVLPTPQRDDGGDLVARGLPDLLAEARSSFDLVVVDAPPLAPGEDGPTVVGVADAAVLVVAAEARSREAADAATALDALGVPSLGIVANRFP